MISKYSIAVLPFINMSSDTENEYFSDGITEEIINALSKIDGLHVTARTSSFVFKNQPIDIREIGKKLNVSLLLEGSVRKSGNNIRITSQLIQADNGYHIWSDTWDREFKDILILQDELAQLIAKKINISPKSVDKENTIKSTDAFDYYLKGQYLLNKWNFDEQDNIISNFKKAIELDPKLTHAYVGLSNCYTWMGSTGNIDPMEAHKKVEYCISSILALDKNMAEVYQVIAGKNFWIEWNHPSALQNINRALQIKPSYYDAYLYKGLIMSSLGKAEEAFDAFFQAERLNPYGDTLNYCIGMLYNLTNDNEKSLEYIEKNIAICPHWYAQYIIQLEVLCKLKRYDEAWAVINKLKDDPKSPLSINELQGYYYASKGNIDEALQKVSNFEDEIKQNPLMENTTSVFFSSIYLLLNETEKALDYLEQGVKHKSAAILFYKLDSIWDELRNHPRYIKAAKALEFPEIEIFGIEKKYKKTTISEVFAKENIKKLKILMEDEKLYLNPTLNLSDLAEAIDISSNQLSQILNEFIGKNYYDYVNSYRLSHFLKLYKEPKYKNFTLLSVAYECGFNSKTTFNTFFKKELGKTPSEYFKK